MASSKNPDTPPVLEPSILDELYGAAFDDALWPSVLTRIADRTRLHANYLTLIDETSGTIRFGAAGRMDPAATHEYERDYYPLDFRVPRLAAHTDYRLVTDADLSTAAERQHSPVHQEWLRRHDIEHMLAGRFSCGPGIWGAIAFHRSRRAGDFTHDEREDAERLVPHLRRALYLRLRIHAERDTRAVPGAQPRRSAFLLKRDRSVVHVEGSALELLREACCLVLRDDKLDSGVPTIARALRRLFDRVSVCDNNLYVHHGVIPARCPGGKLVRLVPVPVRLSEYAHRADEADLVLYVEGYDDPPDAPRTLLRTRFYLTSKEAQVVEMLSEGLTLTAIADTLQVSLNTAKTHLQSAFRKTGTRRQLELVALFNRLRGAPPS